MEDEDESGGESLIHVRAEQDGRLDKILSDGCEGLSRTRVKALILEGAVMVDGAVCRSPSAAIVAGQEMTVSVPAAVAHYPESENIPLNIVYEDAHLLVIDKHAGLVVHPGAGNPSGTLVNALLYHCGDSLSGIGGVLRPGIVHRLDKDTTGLMVVAKSDAAHQGLSAQLSDRTLSREYKALVWKVPSPPVGRVNAPIGRSTANRQKMMVAWRGGRDAITHYRVTEKFGESVGLVECKLESGRTHQIRVHMAHIGHPLVGDPLYGSQATAQRALLKKTDLEPAEIESIIALPRQMLHAFRIGFIHPLTGDEMHFETPLPEDFEDVLRMLRGS